MSSSSYFFTTLNALPIIMVATEKDLQPGAPSPNYFAFTKRILTAQDKRVAKGSARKAPASQTRYH